MAKPILTILNETVEICKTHAIPVNLDKCLALIKTNRAKSDIAVHHDFFNPALTVTGCNSRLFVDYYNQYVNLELPTYNPEMSIFTTVAPVDFVPDAPADDAPATDAKPAKGKNKGGLKKKS